MKKKTLIAAVTGNALEYYDFMLYGVFAQFLAPLYFPSDNPEASTIASFGAFAAGFLMRPLGGLLFGSIGDLYGRKKALTLSIVLGTLPTFVIGILPSYNMIGFWAPLIIVACRLLQGACAAGEYSGASVLIAEYARRDRRGFVGSLLPASSLIGAILALISSAVCLMEGMPAWAWRIPFLMALIWGVLGFYLRNQMEESPLFLMTQKNISPQISLLNICNNHKRNFLCAIGIGAAAVAPFYIISIHIIGLTAVLNLAYSLTMIINAGVMMVWIIFIPIGGVVADKIGFTHAMVMGLLLLILCALPVFWWVHHEISLLKIIVAQITLSIGAAFYIGPCTAFLANHLFPVTHRYRGVAVGVAIGEALFGGTTPLISTGLIMFTNAAIAPAFYLIFCCIISLIALHYCKPLPLAS